MCQVCAAKEGHIDTQFGCQGSHVHSILCVVGDGACGLWSFLMGAGFIDRNAFLKSTVHIDGKVVIRSPLDYYQHDEHCNELVHKMRKLRQMVVEWMFDGNNHHYIQTERPYFDANYTMVQHTTMQFLRDREYTSGVHFFVLAKLYEVDIAIVIQVHGLESTHRDVVQWSDSCEYISCDAQDSTLVLVSWRTYVVPRLLSSAPDVRKLVVLIWNGHNDGSGHFSTALPNVKAARRTLFSNMLAKGSTTHMNKPSAICASSSKSDASKGSQQNKRARSTQNMNKKKCQNTTKKSSRKRCLKPIQSISDRLMDDDLPTSNHAFNASKTINEALHPNEKVRAAMLAFGEGDSKYEIGTCGICRESRIIGYDASLAMNKLYTLRNKLQVKWWKLVDGSMFGCREICERCFKVCKKLDPGVAHPFSGCRSRENQLSKTSCHNNMHFRHVSQYLIDLTEFEITCIAKYTMATSVHVVSNGFTQRGCLAHIPSSFRIANALPWLPEEIEVLIVYQQPKDKVSLNEKAKKMYSVRRHMLEKALNGLLYGVPKGGYASPPNNNYAYEKYIYRDHQDGTKLHGRYFMVGHSPNPAYWNIEIQAPRLQAYNQLASVPQGLCIVCAQGQPNHVNSGQEHDVNDNDMFPEQNYSAHQLATHLDAALRNGYVSQLDDVVTIIGREDDESTKHLIYQTLVQSVGEEAAKQFSLSGHGICVAKLDSNLPHAQILNPWQTEGFWSGLAPRVFSGGGGDITLSTESALPSHSRLQTSLYFEHLIWANTNRFVQHPLLPILAARMLMQEQSQRQAAFGIRQMLGAPKLTEDEIRERMESGDETIFNLLFALQGNVTNTAGYWTKFNKEVKAGLLDVAYIEQSNMDALPPTLIFNSQSCAEYWWPNLKKLLCELNNRVEFPLDMDLEPSTDDDAPKQEILMYSALRRFPHIVGAYFDCRTANFHNTVGRALGIDDVWLRYEFGSSKGHLHSHAVGVSSSMSCMVNRAREDAEAELNSNSLMDEHYSQKFNEHFAQTVYQGLHGSRYDGVGCQTDDDGYQSWHWQSRHSSSYYDDVQSKWVSCPNLWRPPHKKWKRGSIHPASKSFAEATESVDTYARFCIDHDNSSYQHQCTSYCLRPLRESDRSLELDKPFYRCRFGFAKLNINKEVVTSRPIHDDPRFVKVNGQWRFEAPIDNWRTIPKPLASRIWSANESCFPIIIPECRQVADAQILPIADYVADYANKATDNIELARKMFNNLVQVQKRLRIHGTKCNHDVLVDDANEDQRSSTPMDCKTTHDTPSTAKVKTLASFLHSVMQRMAGLPVLTHLQSVMTLSGTPLHRSTRQTKNVSLSRVRFLSKKKKHVPVQHNDPLVDDTAACDDVAHHNIADETKTTLEHYFTFREHHNGIDEFGKPLTLYKWLKRSKNGNRKPVVFPTGVHQLNFTWPLNESWARSMFLLHCPTIWSNDVDALNDHPDFHHALLSLCNLTEDNDSLCILNHENATDIPMGLVRIIQAAYANNKVQQSKKFVQMLKARKRQLADPQSLENCVDSDDEDAKAHQASPYCGSIDLSAYENMQLHQEDDTQDTNFDQLPGFEPPSPNYDFHAQGRIDLINALERLGVSPDQLEMQPPLPNQKLDFEHLLADILPNLAIKYTNIPQSTKLPDALLLRTSVTQRAAIVHAILPRVQHLLDGEKNSVRSPFHLKLLGEAGSGKTMVLHGLQRIIQRLDGSSNAILSLAPTGAVAISMGENGATIQSVIPTFRMPNNSKRNHNQNCLHEQDMPLNGPKLARLRKRLGFDPSTGISVTKTLVIDEISMVGASLFWAIHCRLCQAFEQIDVRSLDNMFAKLDVAVIGDFGQLDPVCATSLCTEFTRGNPPKGLSASGVQLFQTAFNENVICLQTQHRLNLKKPANLRLRQLQLHARDGALDDDDFDYIKSLDLISMPKEAQKVFLQHRVLHVHFWGRDVLRGNIEEVKSLSRKQCCEPSIHINKTKAGRCSNIEADVNQLPPISMLVKNLHVVCTTNGLGYPELTSILGIANGTRGVIVAVLHTHQSLPDQAMVAIVDFQNYRGPPLMGNGWPHTWIPVASITKRCDQGCCERTGIPLTPSTHVTLFKCQGLTCGKGRQYEKMLLYCDHIQKAESKWPRSFYVALTRTIDASDLALTNMGTLRKDLCQTINRAKYHELRKSQHQHNVNMSNEIEERHKIYTSDEGWLAFLTQIDLIANDGIYDAICNSSDRDSCANSGCVYCKLHAEC